MKNNEIVQMLLDDGESTAIPNQIKENPRTLARRHGNCVEKKSKTTSSENKSISSINKELCKNEKESDLFPTIKSFNKNGKSFNSDKAKDQNETDSNHTVLFLMEYFETLVESILICQVHYSYIVGIFSRYANYFRNQNMVIIKDIFTKKCNLPSVNCNKLEISPFLVLLIFFISSLVGYLCGLIVSWEVGLAVGFTILIVLFIGIGLILIGTYSQEWKMALQAGSITSNAIKSLKLFLKVLFIIPDVETNYNPDQLNNCTIIDSHLVISNYSNNYHAAAKFIENIWCSIEKNYSNFVIRMLKASLNQEHRGRRFRKICCLPTFTYFIIAIVCLFSIGTIIKINESDLSKIFVYKIYLIVFCFLAIVLLLSKIAIVYLILKIIFCIIRSPSHNLKGFLKSYNIYGEASTQAFLISEFDCVLEFLAQLDKYSNERRSFILSFIDATGAIDMKVLTEFCSFCQILIKNRNEIPICIIVIADNQLYATSHSTESVNSFLKLTKQMSYCLYLNESSPAAIGDATMETSVINTGKMQDPKHKNSNYENIHYIGINTQNNGYKSDTLLKKLYQNVNDANNNCMMEDLSVKSITDYLVIKSKLSDFNVPHIKELVILVTFIHKLSKVQSISTEVLSLIDLVTLFYHWPFLYSWMTIFVGNNLYSLKKSITIKKLYDTVIRNMLQAAIDEPKVLELSQLDLETNVLESILFQSDIGDLSIEEFVILNSACKIQNLPMQHFIKVALKRRQSETVKTANSLYDMNSDKSVSFKHPFSTIQSQTIKSESTNEQDKGKMTPKSFRKCVQSIKDLFSSLVLSEMSLEDVIWMIGQIDEISKDSLSVYQERIREINANGLVLATCDPTELRNELKMSFGDWHLFYTLISYLRSIEEANDSNIFQDVSEQSNKLSVYNPLYLLEQNQPLLLDMYESNSNDILSDESQCKLCDNKQMNTPMDNDSVWKRKSCPHGTVLSKDHFLSPISVSSISSPKLQTIMPTQPLSTKSFVNQINDLSNFYSVKESEIDENHYLPKATSLPREASFESTTTFSTQLSSPRNSKCLYDMDTKTRTYTLPSEKPNKNSLIKVKHNIGCQSYNHLQSEDQTEMLNDIPVDQIAVLIDGPPSKFQSYLKKSDKPYHSSLYEINKIDYDPNGYKKKSNNFDGKKSYSQTNVRGQIKKKKTYSLKHDTNYIVPIPISTDCQDHHSRDNISNLSNLSPRENEPDIIFRSKSYTDEHSAIINKSLKKRKSDKCHRDRQSKDRNMRSSRSKTKYNEVLNYEVSHSEI